jgi:Flp pilus assembly protein TadD
LWLQRCELYEDQQQWAAALHGRLHLAKLCPEDYANLSEVADLYQRLGDFELSVVYYIQAQTLAPQHPVVANNLGNALQLVHRYEEALTQYQRATAFDPNYFDAWHNCAVTLRRLERMIEAQQAAEHSLELVPQHPKAVWNLALLKLLLHSSMGSSTKPDLPRWAMLFCLSCYS